MNGAFPRNENELLFVQQLEETPPATSDYDLALHAVANSLDSASL